MYKLQLPFPPSLNTYWRNLNGRTLLSKKGRAYKKIVAQTVMIHPKQLLPFTGRLSMDIKLYPPDKRVRDIDNYIKAVLDALEDAGVFENDSQVDLLRVERCCVGRPGLVVISVGEFHQNDGEIG